MTYVSNPKIQRSIPIVMLIALFALSPVRAQSQDGRPVADAGSSRYSATDPVQLDGTGSYDPDSSGPLSYTWRQISPPILTISGANAATPTISGFRQVDAIQECLFELVVRDGELTSLPDTVKVIIVPTFTDSTMALENDAFDPNKPTFIYFGGGSLSKFNAGICTGGGGWGGVGWKEKANVISFNPYNPDPGSTCGWQAGKALTFSLCADRIIVYLSAVAPDYHLPIQTAGLSLGGIPAVDVALRLNKIYADARYAVNRVSFLDATKKVLGDSEYNTRVADFLANPVDGEQCWLDCYDSSAGGSYPNALNVRFVTREHVFARDCYRESLTREDMNVFNSGVIAGAYWSVVGPGKNLQLASTPGVETYKFIWFGNELSSYTRFYSKPSYPGRLPEPVTLIEPVYTEDSNGIILTCQESENAVGYQLLFGRDPYRVMDYSIISDTPAPPNDVITMLPFEETWWTIRVRDQYGSTIYADPIPLYSYFASKPDPSDGALLTVTWAGLRWTVGVAIASHNVYFGDNIDDVSAGAEGTLLTSLGRSAVGVAVDNLIAETTYYWRVDSVEANGTIHMGDVWSFTLAPQAAYDPIPADGAVFVDPLVTLSWAQGLDAASHTVYIGKNFDDVNNATEGTLQEDATYIPEESLARGTVYYWRVDEFDGSEIHKGDVWSFETPPFIEITDPNLVAWWKLDGEYFDLGYVVDYSGYNHHGTPRGNVQPVEGYDGGAMEFDGSNDYINIDGYKGIVTDGTNTSAFTITAWIKATGDGEIVGWGSSGDGNRAEFRVDDGRLRYESGGGNVQTDTNVSDSRWHHVAVTIPENAVFVDVTIYLDGKDDTQPENDTDPVHPLSDYDVIMGQRYDRTNVRWYSGAIDDVRIYDVALSAEEIAALAQ